MYVSMKEMLDAANRGQYAIMAINCFNLETARAVIRAGELENAPVIVNLHQDHILNHCDTELIAMIVKKLAQEYDLPLIDLFAAYQSIKNKADYEACFQYDGVHLSNAGYEILYNLILDTIENIMKDQ